MLFWTKSAIYRISGELRCEYFRAFSLYNGMYFIKVIFYTVFTTCSITFKIVLWTDFVYLLSKRHIIRWIYNPTIQSNGHCTLVTHSFIFIPVKNYIWCYRLRFIPSSGEERLVNRGAVNLRYLHWPAAELCCTHSIFSNSC